MVSVWEGLTKCHLGIPNEDVYSLAEGVLTMSSLVGPVAWNSTPYTLPLPSASSSPQGPRANLGPFSTPASSHPRVVPMSHVPEFLFSRPPQHNLLPIIPSLFPERVVVSGTERFGPPFDFPSSEEYWVPVFLARSCASAFPVDHPRYLVCIRVHENV